MHIGSEADIVGKIPAIVVRIFVNHDVIGVPQPVTAIIVVGGGDGEGEAAEEEPFPAASGQTPDVILSEAAGEASMLKRTVDSITRIAAAVTIPRKRFILKDLRTTR